jgi:hypothetical protein
MSSCSRVRPVECRAEHVSNGYTGPGSPDLKRALTMNGPKHFFIIGAQKAGTTSLYEYIATHPDIFASSKKETKFFCHPKPSPKRTQRYETFFEGRTTEPWVFEASPHYTQYPKYVGIPERLHARFPDARLVYILRHPIERVFSHYLFSLASPSGREHRTFLDALATKPVYLSTSSYYLQIEQFLQFFPASQFHVLLLDDLTADPSATLRRVFEFLDVDPSFEPPNLKTIYNETKGRSTMVSPMIHRFESSSAYQQVPSRIRHWLRRRVRAPVPTKAEIFSEASYNHVHRLLRDDVAKLQEFLRRDLPWDFPVSRYG